MACSARSTIPRRKAGSSSSSARATPVSPRPFASAIVVPSLTVGPTPHDLGGRWPLPSPGPASHFDRTIRTQPVVQQIGTGLDSAAAEDLLESTRFVAASFNWLRRLSAGPWAGAWAAALRGL